jgi:succinate-semialdehyde dehydrogenase/glutarate-semialdehyde dehydrogenase
MTRTPGWLGTGRVDSALVGRLLAAGHDVSVCLRIAEAIGPGMVGLNRGLVSNPSAPFGGVKLLGLGREGGHEGMLEYTEAKYIATSW